MVELFKIVQAFNFGLGGDYIQQPNERFLDFYIAASRKIKHKDMARGINGKPGQFGEPTDDLGERIVAVANSRSLNYSEQNIAGRYFRSDFERSISHANKYLTHAENEVPLSADQKNYLRKTEGLMERAKKNLDRIKTIDPGPMWEMDFDGFVPPKIDVDGLQIEVLPEPLRMVKQITELAARYHNIARNPLNYAKRAMQDAIVSNDYDAASNFGRMIAQAQFNVIDASSTKVH